MEKRPLLAVVISGLILLALTQPCFIKIAKANPYCTFFSEYIEVPPLACPSITILFPAENNTLHNSNKIDITFKANILSGTANVSVDVGIRPHVESVDFSSFIREVYYKPSWQPNSTRVSSFDLSNPWSTTYIINLTEIPEGDQTVTLTAYGEGGYAVTKYIARAYPWLDDTESVWCDFYSVSNYTIGFTVDTVSPQVSVLEMDKKTFGESDVPLSFTVNEHASIIKYCLDGQDNVTLTGNTTLTGLTNGEHYLTVYAVDEAGNMRASETINFRVAPFQSTLIVAFIITVAIIGIGLLIYFKKRNGGNNP